MKKISLNSDDINKIFNLNIEKQYFTGCNVDSRLIKKGNIFFAIKGKSNDGNKYIAEAKINGATLAIVEKKDHKVKIPQILVNKSHLILIKLAKFIRNNSKSKFIAITGSVGKTSTKDALAHILKNEKNIFSARKSYNNIFGVPLEILNMPNNTKIGIFEVGMNHKNEIKKLISILKPNIGVILNINYVHGGNFNSLKDIALAKAEIIDEKYPLDTLIVNKDTTHFKLINAKAGKIKIKNIFTYSTNKNANIMLDDFRINKSQLNIAICIYEEKKIKYKMNSTNSYLITNTMALIACLKSIKYDLNLIKNLKDLSITKGRGNITKLKKDNKIIKLHDHSYNSSPTSLFASLNSFLKISNQKNLIIVGDMHELGSKSNYYHIKVLNFLSKNRNSIHLLVGKNFFKNRKKYSSANMHFFNNVEYLNSEIVNFVEQINQIFIKGSNSIGLYKTVNYLNNIMQIKK